MVVPDYPDLRAINFDMRSALHPHLSMLPDGISEFTFAGLYLFRDTYNYHVARLPGENIIVVGEKEGASFCMLPCGIPEDHGLLQEIIQQHRSIKGLSERHIDHGLKVFEELGYVVHEDRDNFDYLYHREDLAHLEGRRFHKKRNHVNAFINTYSFEEAPMELRHRDDAREILEAWQSTRHDRSDYAAAKEAIDRMEELNFSGYIIHVDGRPAAYTLGEPVMRGRSFIVHFEKARDEYRGIYQYINKAFAASLPRHYLWINREQDLGDEGLRQSKMTYRPSGFVKKFRVYPPCQERRATA